MVGRLDRLYTFARTAERDALENFTTEALAAAIEVDPRPLLRALPAAVAPAGPIKDVDLIAVRTQMQVDGGIVDLVVEVVVDGVVRSHWIEVKAHAGLSGAQLDRYREAAEKWHTAPRPAVIMLCKRPLTTAAPTLRWNELRAQIFENSHVYWQELRTFVEHQRMADDFDRPISAGQLGAAPDVQVLLRRTARLALEFLGRDDLPRLWGESKFPASETKILAAIALQFTRFGRLVVDSRRHPWVCFGVNFFNRGPQLSLWVEVQRGHAELFKLAESLPAPWTRHPRDAPPWFGASVAIAGDLDQEVAMEQLRQWALELEAAGLLAELPKWRLKPAVEDEGDV
jgi:hypothetical protein